MSSLEEKARKLAERLHAGQTRKGTSLPYATHPAAVAGLVRERGGSETQVAAAWLHDAVEDGPRHAAAEVLETCGAKVLILARELTRPPELDKLEWGRRLAHLSPEAALVAACDKLHNMSSILSDHAELGDAVWERFRGGRDRCMAYYLMAVPALCERAPAALSNELRLWLGRLILLKEGP